MAGNSKSWTPERRQQQSILLKKRLALKKARESSERMLAEHLMESVPTTSKMVKGSPEYRAHMSKKIKAAHARRKRQREADLQAKRERMAALRATRKKHNQPASPDKPTLHQSSIVAPQTMTIDEYKLLRCKSEAHHLKTTDKVALIKYLLDILQFETRYNEESE